MNNKEYLKNVYKILFEGMVTEDQIRNIEDMIKLSAVLPGLVSEEGRAIIPQAIVHMMQRRNRSVEMRRW
jgi:hypothetical protein